MIGPLRCTYVVFVRKTDEVLCGGYKWVSRFEARAGAPNGRVSAEWSRCPGFMARRPRDSVVPLRRNSAVWMPARIGRLPAGVGRRNPVTIRKVSLMVRSIRQVWALRHHTGVLYSAVEWTRARVAVRNVVAPAPEPEPASCLRIAKWYLLLAKWLKVSAVRERPVQP